MQAEILEKELTRFGLSQSEARIYGFLLRNGKSTISEISKRLEIASTNMYPLVKILMNKGFVESTFTKPIKLRAVPVNKALDMFIMQRKILISREVNSLEKVRENLVAACQGIEGEEEKAEADRFQILKEGSIYSKILVSLDKTSSSLYCFMSKRNFLKLYNTGFLDRLAKRIDRKAIRVIFLLDESLRNIDLGQIGAEVGFVKEVNMNDFLVFDCREAFYYLDRPVSGEDMALWTTLPSLVTMFSNMFEMERRMGSRSEPHEAEYQKFLLAKEAAKKLFSSLLDGHKVDSIKGASGCKHKFDILLQLNSEVTAADFIFSDKPINIQRVLPFYVKAYDLKESVGKFILFSNGEIDHEAKEFLEDNKIVLRVMQ